VHVPVKGLVYNQSFSQLTNRNPGETTVSVCQVFVKIKIKQNEKRKNKI
jgi:hypothetical protein